MTVGATAPAEKEDAEESTTYHFTQPNNTEATLSVTLCLVQTTHSHVAALGKECPYSSELNASFLLKGAVFREVFHAPALQTVLFASLIKFLGSYEQQLSLLRFLY